MRQRQARAPMRLHEVRRSGVLNESILRWGSHQARALIHQSGALEAR